MISQETGVSLVLGERERNAFLLPAKGYLCYLKVYPLRVLASSGSFHRQVMWKGSLEQPEQAISERDLWVSPGAAPGKYTGGG